MIKQVRNTVIISPSDTPVKMTSFPRFTGMINSTGSKLHFVSLIYFISLKVKSKSTPEQVLIRCSLIEVLKWILKQSKTHLMRPREHNTSLMCHCFAPFNSTWRSPGELGKTKRAQASTTSIHLEDGNKQYLSSSAPAHKPRTQKLDKKKWELMN